MFKNPVSEELIRHTLFVEILGYLESYGCEIRSQECVDPITPEGWQKGFNRGQDYNLADWRSPEEPYRFAVSYQIPSLRGLVYKTSSLVIYGDKMNYCQFGASYFFQEVLDHPGRWGTDARMVYRDSFMRSETIENRQYLGQTVPVQHFRFNRPGFSIDIDKKNGYFLVPPDSEPEELPEDFLTQLRNKSPLRLEYNIDTQSVLVRPSIEFVTILGIVPRPLRGEDTLYITDSTDPLLKSVSESQIKRLEP